jgi:hypothetical protein
MDKFSTLEYCCDVLSRREAADSGNAWFWGVRRKVARYCADFERPLRQPEPSRPLTPEEQQSIESTHPLLQPREQTIPQTPTASYEWLQDFRKRLRTFLNTVAAIHENEPNPNE